MYGRTDDQIVGTGEEAGLRECVPLLGPTMKYYVTARKRWDVYIIVAVMQGHLPTVFASKLGLEGREFEGKELLSGLLQTSEGRTRRGHSMRPSEADALDTMRHIEAVMEKCGLADGAAEVATRTSDVC